MEIKVVDKSKNRFEFQIIGEDHTLCNALIEELKKIPEVDSASYGIRHPLEGIPKVLVESKKKDPQDLLLLAIKNLSKKNDSFKKEFAKAFEK